jgi:hypothetical protein
MSPHQNAGQNYNIKTAKTLFQTVTEFSYSNDIYDKINSDLILEMHGMIQFRAFYLSASHFKTYVCLHTHVHARMCAYVYLCACETSLAEEHRL